MSPEEQRKFRAELDGLSDDAIKARFTSGGWSNEESQLAQIYIQARALGRLKAQTDEMKIALSAKNAALASSGIALIAAILSIVALYKSW
jgi:hypothetical protein